MRRLSRANKFVYYIADRHRYLAEFNNWVVGVPRYPIKIKFYLDESWRGLQELIDDFNATGGASPP